MQIRMTEIAHLHFVLGLKDFGDGLAPDDVFFPSRKRVVVERHVLVSVVAEFEAGVEPLIQRLDAVVHFAEFVEFALVDEAYGGNLLLFQRGE